MNDEERDFVMFLTMGMTLALVEQFHISYEQAEQYIRDKAEGNKLEVWEEYIDSQLERRNE